VLIDIYSAVVGPDGQLRSDLAADDVHMNAAGYGIITPLAASAIAAAH
jgi:lysophospholipase L1-like esterase